MVMRETVTRPADERGALGEESAYLYRCMFGRSPTDTLVDAYVRAHAEIGDLRALDALQLNTVHVIVAQRLDAVGIEPCLRGKEMRHALSSKMLLLGYLAECEGANPEFSRRAAAGRMALVKMSMATLAALFRLLRGYAQKVRHGLI